MTQPNSMPPNDDFIWDRPISVGEVDSTTAFALIRTLPGEGRILTLVPSSQGGLLFQWESGIELRWDGPDSAFVLTSSEKLRVDWAKWKAERPNPDVACVR